MQGGRTPTTPTIAALIAAVQCQEAVKWLHGLPTLRGQGWVFEGWTTEAYRVEYQRRADCYNHDMLEDIITLPASSESLTVGELLATARQRLGSSAVLELSRDVLEKLTCPQCGDQERYYQSLGRVRAEQALCPACGEARREVGTFYQIRGTEAFLDRPLAQLGIPRWDIVTAVSGNRRLGLEIGGDAPEILGPLAVQQEALTWL